MRVDPPRRSLPIWLVALVLALAVGLGLALRPTIQNALGGGDEAEAGPSTAAPPVRCPDPSGGDLALSERLSAQVQPAGVVYSRAYELERPGQPPLAFSGGGDAQSAPLSCAAVRFGPGPRVAFGRGPEAVVVELVGPRVNRFLASTNPDLVKLSLEPRWRLGLGLADYVAGTPALDEAGRGRLVLERPSPAAGLPTRLVLTTRDGGATYALDRAASLAGL